MHKIIFTITLLISVTNLFSSELEIVNNSGYYINLKLEWWAPGNVFLGFKSGDNVWLCPDLSLNICLMGEPGVHGMLGYISVSYTESIDENLLEQLDDPNHNRAIEPKIISEKAEFNFSSESMYIMRSAKYLPAMIITNDPQTSQPVINFPRDVKSLQAAIEEETAKRITWRVQDSLPQFPSGAGQGGIPAIIGGYAAEALKE